jgi:hypothetical protein
MLGGCTDPNPASYKDIYEGAISIHNHLIQSGDQGIMMGIPSFLIVNPRDEMIAEIANRLIKEGPPASANWGREIAYLRAFGSNFFGRAPDAKSENGMMKREQRSRLRKRRSIWSIG